MKMMSNSAIPFDHGEVQREGWDVFKCMPDAEGRPQYQLQHLDAPDNGEPVSRKTRKPGCTSWPVFAPGPRCTGRRSMRWTTPSAC